MYDIANCSNQLRLFYQKKSTKLDILFLGDYGEKLQRMIDFEFRK